MTRELRQKTKIQLALAIAQGRSVALWARENQVPRSTAYRWASQPEVRAAAESRRRRARKGALARMASRACRASHEVATLAECAESESVRLRALRSIVSGAIATSKFAVLKRRMSAIKEELHERTEDTVRNNLPKNGRPSLREGKSLRGAKGDTYYPPNPKTAGPSCPQVSCSLVNKRSKKRNNAPFCLIFSVAQDAFQGSKRAPHLVSPL
jgi:hypothetical protein